MEEPHRHNVEEAAADSIFDRGTDVVATWRAVRRAPDYRAEAARQAASAARADVEDRVMEWIDGVATEASDDM